MKYIEALKKYNEGKTKWCMPRKGSIDYVKIKKLIDTNYSPGTKTPLKSKSVSNISIKNQIYKSLSKESKTIIDKISKKPNLKKSSNLYITDKRVQKIQRFFKKYAIKDKYSLNNRVSVGGFDWNMQFTWHGLPEREYKLRKSDHDPVRSPTMAGGLFAISKSYFEKLGTYDGNFI